MIKYQCDFCKKDITPDESYLIGVSQDTIINGSRDKYGRLAQTTPILPIHACPECRGVFVACKASTAPIKSIDFTTHIIDRDLPNRSSRSVKLPASLLASIPADDDEPEEDEDI